MIGVHHPGSKGGACDRVATRRARLATRAAPPAGRGARGWRLVCRLIARFPIGQGVEKWSEVCAEHAMDAAGAGGAAGASDAQQPQPQQPQPQPQQPQQQQRQEAAQPQQPQPQPHKVRIHLGGHPAAAVHPAAGASAGVQTPAVGGGADASQRPNAAAAGGAAAPTVAAPAAAVPVVASAATAATAKAEKATDKVQKAAAGEKRPAGQVGSGAGGGGGGGNAPPPKKKYKKRAVAATAAAARVRAQLPSLSLVPESRLFCELAALDRRLDALICNVKAHIAEALLRPSRKAHVLRLRIFNTYTGQRRTGESADAENCDKSPSPAVSAAPAAWTLHVEGCLLENGRPVSRPAPARVSHKAGAGARAAAAAAHAAATAPTLSAFIERMEIELDDKQQYPGKEGSVVWSRAAADRAVDGFELHRLGETEVNARVRIHLAFRPARFQLSPALHALLGPQVETRPRVLQALWQYIKHQELQDAERPDHVRLNAELRAVLRFDAPGRAHGEAGAASFKEGDPDDNNDVVPFSEVVDRLDSLLEPAAPVVVDHRIALGGRDDEPSGRSPEQCFDVEVDMVSNAEAEQKRSGNAGLVNALTDNSKEVKRHDEQIRMLCVKISEHRRRRAFLDAFAEAPADFVRATVIDQKRQLARVSNAHAEAAVKERTPFYELPWAEDVLARIVQVQAEGRKVD